MLGRIRDRAGRYLWINQEASSLPLSGENSKPDVPKKKVRDDDYVQSVPLWYCGKFYPAHRLEITAN